MLKKISCIVTLLALTSTGWATVKYSEHSKNSAEIDLKTIFAHQENAQSRSVAPAELRLQRRVVSSTQGIELKLAGLEASESRPQLVIARLGEFPQRSDWQQWQNEGVKYVGYLGKQHWLLNVTTDMHDAFASTRALSFSALQTQDKIDPLLDEHHSNARFFDVKKHLVVLNVQQVKEDKQLTSQLLQRFHQAGQEYIDNTGGNQVTIVTDPTNIEQIAAMDTIMYVMPGEWQSIPLVEGVRITATANNVAGINSHLTGNGIRMANREGNGFGNHQDYWEHDASGMPIQGRWTALAESSGCLAGSWHGEMTSGIMLGNGWHSSDNNGDSMAFRGIAPEATFECYWHPQARPHVSNHSFVSPIDFDGAVVGQISENRFHPHTMAAGNNGQVPMNGSQEIGYFSLLNSHKNPIIVGNAQVDGRIYSGSSIGPTFDGRIKPDISAPTGQYDGSDDPFFVEIESIELRRGPFLVYLWTFDDLTSDDWHCGWGQPDAGVFGQQHLDISQTPEGNMLISVDEQPWEGTGWRRNPLVGTQITPSCNPGIFGGLGEPLDFTGHINDVLKIRYRSVGRQIGYFDLFPVWFRSFPTDPFPVINGHELTGEDWTSQGLRQNLGIGDGQWHTLEFPLGDAMREEASNHWDVGPTWSDQTIRYLSLHLAGTRIQPTPRTGELSYMHYRNSAGTSGAAPVLAGGYALAMEHLLDLYPNSNLDDMLNPSIYSELSTPAGFAIGRPLNSTWKALFIHTATDMSNENSAVGVTPPNPDTGVATSYYPGPDYATGYGMVNVQSAIHLMSHEQSQSSVYPYQITENELVQGIYHSYEIAITSSIQAKEGLKMTLVWDDEPASSLPNPTDLRLVNNLGLLVESPSGEIFYPWSIDLPYDIYEPGNGPHQVEPEPIEDSDIVPARSDVPNDRDNVEQVVIGKNFELGTWRVYVVDNGIATPDPQKYSLVISSWDSENQCHSCNR